MAPKTDGMNARRRFKELLAGSDIVVQPVAFDALSALLAEAHGFKAVGLGGYQMGAHLGMTEPILPLGDVADVTRVVTAAIPDIPVMVDAGAGYGEPIHVMHATKVLEQAGAASIHIEDQVFPKRAHYHKAIEQIISAEAMADRIVAAVDARRDPDFAIVARCDAFRTDGYDEAIRRSHIYAEAGADALMIFPNDEDQTRRYPRDAPDIPLVYVNTAGNRHGRPVFPAEDLESMGYKVVAFAIVLSIVAARAMDDVLAGIAATGELNVDTDDLVNGRDLIERLVKLERLQAVESETGARW